MRPVVLIASVTVVLVAAMVFTGMGPNVVLVVSLSALVGTGVWVLTALAEATPAATPMRSGEPAAPAPRSERRVTRLRTGLAYAGPDGVVFERLHENLVAVIDDQLRVAHQIDRTADPVAARAVLGDELQRFVDDAAAAAASLGRPRALDRILTLIEQL